MAVEQAVFPFVAEVVVAGDDVLGGPFAAGGFEGAGGGHAAGGFEGAGGGHAAVNRAGGEVGV